MLFQLNNAAFDYEPYPIGLLSGFVGSPVYGEMLDAWPEDRLFKHMPELGKKYSLSERNNPDLYAKIVREVPIWRQVHAVVKSPEFVAGILKTLGEHGVELGLEGALRRVNRPSSFWERLNDGLRGGSDLAPRGLKSRFEFSMLPSAGGCIKPHTDSPGKLVTVVVAVVGEDEWDACWGGGTEVMKAVEPRRAFNHLNRQLEFDDVETLRVFEFGPRQAVVFVKTFNSLHAVRPMRGPEGRMRKTLTINIEAETNR